jgi:hypothetical protein
MCTHVHAHKHTRTLKELDTVRMQIANTLSARSDVRIPLALSFIAFGCSFCCWLANARKSSRAQVGVKQDARQPGSEKASVRAEQMPGQLAAAGLPPVPANSFQLESDFRQLRSSPEMLYQYVKVSRAGGWGRGASSALLAFCVAQQNVPLPAGCALSRADCNQESWFSIREVSCV